MTRHRWWLAAALLTLALTCSTRAQDEPSPEGLPMPHPCSAPACTGGCGGSCPATTACPASARHNEGTGCCAGQGCCAGCSGCCAATAKKAKKACHAEDCAPSAALILPTWFGPMPVPLPPPMASLFFGAGVDYHVHVGEPMPPPPAPPICSVPTMGPGCPFAFPPPPPPVPPMMGVHRWPAGCPAGCPVVPPPVVSYTIIQRPQTVAPSWHLHVCNDCDKAEMEMEGSATKICCESMDVTIGDKHALKVSVHERQVVLEGESIKAFADKISKGGDGESLVLDGHVHIEYEQDDQKVDATVGHVKISLKDGHMDIKMGGHETVPASCH